MNDQDKHASHPQIANRLKRAQGHLASVVKMIEDGRPCAEIAQQMHAVENAVRSAKRTLIRDHIDHCLEDVADAGTDARRSMLEDFKRISKYL